MRFAAASTVAAAPRREPLIPRAPLDGWPGGGSVAASPPPLLLLPLPLPDPTTSLPSCSSACAAGAGQQYAAKAVGSTTPSVVDTKGTSAWQTCSGAAWPAGKEGGEARGGQRRSGLCWRGSRAALTMQQHEGRTAAAMATPELLQARWLSRVVIAT